MATPQIIITLSASGQPVIELPGLNGSRRKINLEPKSSSIVAIGIALEVLKDISEIKIDDTIDGSIRTNAAKAVDLLNQLQGKINRANEAANGLTSTLNSDNTFSDIILRILEAQVSNSNNLGSDGAPTQAQVRHWEKHSGIFGDPSCSFCISEGKFEPGKNREKAIKGISTYECLRLGLISRGYTQNPKNPTIFSRFNHPNILIINGKVQDKNHIQWSETNTLRLIEDGKVYAKKTGFIPQEAKPRTIGKGAKVRTLVKKPKPGSKKVEKIIQNLQHLNF